MSIIDSVYVSPVTGAYSADIGRIASKHVKVTVSNKNSTHSKERPVTVRSPQKNSTNTMNHVNEKDAPQQRQVEEMDTQEGNNILFSMPLSFSHQYHMFYVGHGDGTI